GVDERLERAAQLTAAVEHAVERGLGPVAAAHHGEDVAGVRVDHDARRLEVGGVGRAVPARLVVGMAEASELSPLDRLELLLQLLLERHLELTVEGGVHTDAVVIELGAVALLE